MTAQVTRIPRVKRGGLCLSLEQLYDMVTDRGTVLQFPAKRPTSVPAPTKNQRLA